jgi:hypothetical protein
MLTPTTLPNCGHSLDLDSANSLYDADGDNMGYDIDCPYCREPSDYTNLQINYALRQCCDALTVRCYGCQQFYGRSLLQEHMLQCAAVLQAHNNFELLPLPDTLEEPILEVDLLPLQVVVVEPIAEEDYYRVGKQLCEGDGVEINIEEGLQLLEQAANSGCSDANLYLRKGDLPENPWVVL